MDSSRRRPAPQPDMLSLALVPLKREILDEPSQRDKNAELHDTGARVTAHYKQVAGLLIQQAVTDLEGLVYVPANKDSTRGPTSPLLESAEVGYSSNGRPRPGGLRLVPTASEQQVMKNLSRHPGTEMAEYTVDPSDPNIKALKQYMDDLEANSQRANRALRHLGLPDVFDQPNKTAKGAQSSATSINRTSATFGEQGAGLLRRRSSGLDDLSRNAMAPVSGRGADGPPVTPQAPPLSAGASFRSLLSGANLGQSREDRDRERGEYDATRDPRLAKR